MFCFPRLIQLGILFGCFSALFELRRCRRKTFKEACLSWLKPRELSEQFNKQLNRGQKYRFQHTLLRHGASSGSSFDFLFPLSSLTSLFLRGVRISCVSGVYRPWHSAAVQRKEKQGLGLGPLGNRSTPRRSPLDCFKRPSLFVSSGDGWGTRSKTI